MRGELSILVRATHASIHKRITFDMHANPFEAKSSFDLGNGQRGTLYSLSALQRSGMARVGRLPVSLRIILESLLRNCDGLHVTAEHVRTLANWEPRGKRTAEIPFLVARVVLHEVAGIPALGDLAAMRSAASRFGVSPRPIEPRVPVTMVVDHTLAVDFHDVPDAIEKNMQLEIQRNEERFRFLKWSMGAFSTLKVIPPGHGILHQVNLEYLARGLMSKDGVYYPDTLVGSDSHTVMINGIGVVGWGVGGIEASAAMLGQPIYMLTPDVVGVHLRGRIQEGITATDVVLTLTETLRKAGVVSAFVEFFGEGVNALSVPDRATLSNMSPEYGASIGFFPPDEAVCDFFRITGRTETEIAAFKNYFVAQEMFGVPALGDIDYTRVVEFDLSSVKPSIAGPKRPQDRVELPNAKANFMDWLSKPVGSGGYGKQARATGVLTRGDTADHLTHGSILIAAITSCTNTSNPSVMLAAGLLARNAIRKGLQRKPWVKASLAPGSKAVSSYFEKTGLQSSLDALGFRLVGYGCATCNGMSGPLDPAIESRIAESGLIGVAVLSGNRNFEARIHPSLKASYLMSPPLVVAYSIAGRIDIDLTREPLGTGSDGNLVYLRDIWPSTAEIASVLSATAEPETYRKVYGDFGSNKLWNAISAPSGEVFSWDPSSLYIKEPPFFAGFTMQPRGLANLRGARALAILGDSVSTDHISPVSTILPNSSSGEYLKSLGIAVADFNSYGSRRMNHDVMIRGTFANPRLKNLLLPGTEGGVTVHQPTGETMSIYDAAMRYRKDGVPLIVFGGQDYGMGSARDWAAKGTNVLGVRAVVAKSFEKIHRTNLVCLGVLPCQLDENTTVQSLKLDGSESFEILGLTADPRPQQEVTLVIHRKNGESHKVPLLLRVDTPMEIEYAKHGGVLPYMLRSFLAASGSNVAAA
jgi:aconitate hydratase